MRRLHRFTGGLALALPVVAVVAALPPAKAAEDHGEGIRKWFESYDAAFNAKDISRLAAFYHPDVTIFEGGGVKGPRRILEDPPFPHVEPAPPRGPSLAGTALVSGR